MGLSKINQRIQMTKQQSTNSKRKGEKENPVDTEKREPERDQGSVGPGESRLHRRKVRCKLEKDLRNRVMYDLSKLVSEVGYPS